MIILFYFSCSISEPWNDIFIFFYYYQVAVNITSHRILKYERTKISTHFLCACFIFILFYFPLKKTHISNSNSLNRVKCCKNKRIKKLQVADAAGQPDHIIKKERTRNEWMTNNSNNDNEKKKSVIDWRKYGWWSKLVVIIVFWCSIISTEFGDSSDDWFLQRMH